MKLNTAASDCRHGRMIYLANDAYIGRSLDQYGQWGEEEVRLIKLLTSPGDFVIEGGANIGSETVPIAKHLGYNGHMLCFEPQKPCVSLLTDNLAYNSIRNVTVEVCALGGVEGRARLTPADYTDATEELFNFGSVCLMKDGEGQPAKIQTLDNMLGIHRLVRLIKLDIEGAELPALVGARETIKKDKPILYVENNGGTSSPNLIQFIQSQGYQLYWHTPPIYEPDNWRGNLNNIFPNQYTAMMLGLPHEFNSALRDEVIRSFKLRPVLSLRDQPFNTINGR